MKGKGNGARGKELRHAIEDMTQEVVQESIWTDRDYLGISQVWRCEAELYDHLCNGAYSVSRDHARPIYENKLHVDDMVERLQMVGQVVSTVSELELLNGQVRGHPHGRLDGTMFHVKAIGSRAFEDVKKTKRALRRDYQQMQLYLLAADETEMLVIYKSRETGVVWPVMVWENGNQQDQLLEKLQGLVAAVDEGNRPECSCGRHE